MQKEVCNGYKETNVEDVQLFPCIVLSAEKESLEIKVVVAISHRAERLLMLCVFGFH